MQSKWLHSLPRFAQTTIAKSETTQSRNSQRSLCLSVRLSLSLSLASARFLFVGVWCEATKMVKGRRKCAVLYGIEGFTDKFCFTSGKICVHVSSQTYHHHVFFFTHFKWTSVQVPLGVFIIIIIIIYKFKFIIYMNYFK